MYGIAGLLTGRTLCDRYRIDAVAGRGGMGAVYRAADLRLGREVAVKVIGIVSSDEDEHARLQARFIREARAAAQLHHPNVVSVYDFGTDDELGLDFLVMELLHGEDLSVRLARSGPPPLHVALGILRQAARGLAAGHRAGLVHRDVKPGNLFLETSDDPDHPDVRVLDFGIAQVSGEEGTMTALTEYGRAPFSPAYASPEQVRGDDRITAASDVFSLAAVGYQLVTGTRPFTATEAARQAIEVGEAVRDLRARAPDLPMDVHDALVRALALEPAARFADGAGFADALSGFVPPPNTATMPPAAAPAPRRVRAPLGAVSVEPDEGTQFQPAPRVNGAADHTEFAPRPRERTVLPPAARPQPAFAPQPAPSHAPAPQPPVAAPRRGGVRRAARAMWEFTLTLVAMALFVGAWTLAGLGVMENDAQAVYAGAAASILFTPLAIHRLTGGRGRYRFELFGSIAATAAAVYYVGTDGDPAITLAAIFGVQVVASFLMARLTRRRERAPEPYAGD